MNRNREAKIVFKQNNSLEDSRYLHIVLAALISISAWTNLQSTAYGHEKSHIFSTGQTLELDRCASAWLIKRYVDSKAVFQFYPDGELIEAGTAFDTPDATLVRTHNRSTFEVIALRYGVTEPGVVALGKLIREVETNFWGGNKSLEAIEIDRKIRDLVDKAPDNQAALQNSFAFFDRFITEFKE